MYQDLECSHATFFSIGLQTAHSILIKEVSVEREIPLTPVMCQTKAQYNEVTDLQTEVSPLQNPPKTPS